MKCENGNHTPECQLKAATEKDWKGCPSVASALLSSEAMALYKPPFRHECGYIFDAAHQMVADEAGNHLLEVRGWGRIGSMKDAENLQDKVGDIIAVALTEYWEAHQGR
jgi:hypothetical protein